MYKFSFLIVFTFISFTVFSQESSEDQKIKEMISLFFDGLHKGDSSLVRKTLHKEIKIQTTFTNKTGKNILVSETREKLLKTIASKKASDTYFEKLLSYTIKVDGNLASVWTPYEFYYNGNFSHCGANSFQLFNNNGTWEIIYLVDMRRRENCKVTGEKN
ncbi:nuclear transport factor 2 family protein [uncultured Tenacibaculum sp.]|uniref:nuclear transport factor 2 family protein n=1 Tax=uncultured Tenacibaculum sp. TaxID=174713 RepID=UPI002617A76E|nr:nuclear transport factor 2 family protein [uncultured Tenacibaculum sp.]